MIGLPVSIVSSTLCAHERRLFVPHLERQALGGIRPRPALSAATKVTHLTPAIGTEIEDIDLRQLSDKQKDEL